jgi:phosphate starvation-inducible PhoH-like protein
MTITTTRGVMGKPKLKFETTDADIRMLGNRKKFHTKDLISFQPKTKKQEQFFNSYYTQIPLILQSGSAGTGKSTVALYAALSEVLDEGIEYKKIILIRSAVETRSIGFLPGDLDEKMEPYERPYKDIVDYLLPYANSYNNLKALGYLEFMLSTHIRGLTFDNAVIIVDEVQNMDQPELLSVMTRIGVSSKMILCGDNKQDDLFRQKFKSGFDYLEKLFKGIDTKYRDIVHYSIDDILRSDLVREILIADSKL